MSNLGSFDFTWPFDVQDKTIICVCNLLIFIYATIFRFAPPFIQKWKEKLFISPHLAIWPCREMLKVFIHYCTAVLGKKIYLITKIPRKLLLWLLICSLATLCICSTDHYLKYLRVWRERTRKEKTLSPCWHQRSEKNGLIALSSQESNSNSNHSVHPKYVEDHL